MLFLEKTVKVLHIFRIFINDFSSIADSPYFLQLIFMFDFLIGRSVLKDL